MQGRTVGQDVVGGGYGVGAQRHVEAVDEVDILPLDACVEECRPRVGQRVPAHLRHLQVVGVGGGQGELPDGHVEYAEAVGVALVGVAAHQLHAEAHAQHRLPQRHDEPVHARGPQVRHGGAGLAHAGEYHLVGRADGVEVVGYFGLGAKALHGVADRADVARVVFDYGYAHRVFSCFFGKNTVCPVVGRVS